MQMDREGRGCLEDGVDGGSEQARGQGRRRHVDGEHERRMHRRAVAVLGRGGKVDGAVEELGALGEVAALALVVNGAGTLGVLEAL